MHVVESYEAGVEVAIKSYIENSPPHIEHCMLYGLRPFRVYQDAVVPDEFLSLGISKNPLKSFFSLRRHYREWRPDIVHLHSSYAGFVGRLAIIPKRKLLYSPHGYAFQRTDVNSFLRLSFYSIEYLLSFRCLATVVCGYGEKKLAELFPRNRVICAPNLATISEPPESSAKKTFDVVMAGRLTPSKDLSFFLATVKELSKTRALKYLWIGDGDQDQVASLVAHGVKVTGWVTGPEVVANLSKGQLYFHSAAWEGNPISVLEAAAVGLPILVRDIHAFSDLPNNIKATAPKHAAKLILDHLDGQTKRLSDARDHINLNNTRTRQAAALAEAYQFVVEVNSKK